MARSVNSQGCKPLLSIIIPCLNERSNILDCLQRLAVLKPLGAELIVVDGGSRDATVALSEPLADIVLRSAAGRAAQMNAGAACASGAWLLFLHADTILPDDVGQWLASLRQGRDDWGFFRLRLSGANPLFRLIERAINGRSRFTAVATGDQCQFVRRSVFRRLRGFADIALMEDVELSHRLRRLSKPLIWKTPAMTSSRRWEQKGILRTVLLMWGVRLAYRLGVKPLRLKQWYYGAAGHD